MLKRALFGLVTLSTSSVLAADVWTDPHPGIRHLQRTQTAGALQIDALYIDTCAPGISFRASGPGEGSKTTRTFATELGLQAAINADFVDDIGLGVGNGGQVIPGRVDSEAQGYAVFGDGQVEFIENESVIAASPAWAKEMVGGHWTQIHNGVARAPEDVNGACTVNGQPRGNTPRTAIAMSKDGRTVLFVTIGSQTTAVRSGVNCAEWSTVLAGLGAHWALNLDGGGSSVMYVQGKGVDGVVNHPSDPGGALRSVPSHLGVYAKGTGAPGSCNVPPARGFLDKADCTSLVGWSYSPAEPTKSNEVLLVLGGALFAPNTTYSRVRADVKRPDVAPVVGSEAHGFDTPFPRSLMTGTPKDIAAIAMSTFEGGRPSQLEGSPKTLTCTKPKLEGRKRWVVSPEVFAKWKFSPVEDLVQYTDSELAQVPDSPDFTDSIEVVRSPSGELYLLDGGKKRKVDSAVVRAWRLDATAARSLSQSELDALVTGDTLQRRPELAKGEGPKVFLLEPPPEAPNGNSSGSSGAVASGGVSEEGEREFRDTGSSDSACMFTGRRSSSSLPAAGFFVLLIVFTLTRKRR
jgi:hypothetical protein